MSNSNLSIKTQSSNGSGKATYTGTVEVLYQKMGDRWFAFSLVGDDVFVGSLTEEQIAGDTYGGFYPFEALDPMFSHESLPYP